MRDRIIVFGTGSVAEYFINIVDAEKVDIIAFAQDKPDTYFHGVNCIKTKDINMYEYDYVVVASGYVEKIIESLVTNGIPEEKIISFIYDDSSTYKMIQSRISKVLDDKYNRRVAAKWLKEGIVLPEIYPAVVWNHEVSVRCFQKDFVREMTLQLISKRIKEEKIYGAVAELGVYKGDFTVLIDNCFPDKKLFLYDTFGGFDLKDLDDDVTINNIEGEKNKFKDTSVEVVLGRIANKDRVVTKQGYFPESFSEGDEKFCFISIDLNLEKPVYSALSILFPLLSHGGFILVSDYYAPFYGGTRKAVDRWCKENNEVFIPVADFYGSVLITKR